MCEFLNTLTLLIGFPSAFWVVCFLPSGLPCEIPEGMIASFEAILVCPDGWTEWTTGAGRVEVGVGDYSGTAEDDRQEEATFALGQTGGELYHALTENEMPSHDHRVLNYDEIQSMEFAGSGGTGLYTPAIGGSTFVDNALGTGFAGDGQFHNNLPPYIVVTRCRKDATDSTSSGSGSGSGSGGSTSSVELVSSGFQLSSEEVSQLRIMLETGEDINAGMSEEVKATLIGGVMAFFTSLFTSLLVVWINKRNNINV